MFSSRTLLSAVLLGVASTVLAQDYTAFPAACSTACGNYVKNSWLCGKRYPAAANSTNAFQACFCDVIDSAQVSQCASCLNTNNASSAGTIVTKTTELCQNFAQGCVYQCDFTTCDSSDVACQCNKDYLQDIYNCASCNTNNKNTGKTQISDYQALLRSCQAQGLSNPNDAAKSTDSLPSPTSMSYVAPSLTGNGVVAPAKTTTSAPVSAVSHSAIVTTSRELPTTMSQSSIASVVSEASSVSATSSSVAAMPTGNNASGAGKSCRLGRGAVGGAAVFLLSLLTF